jgi:anti-sigma factor RsiW
MNCRACAKKLPQYVQGRLSEQDSRSIAEHIKSCGECQNKESNFRYLWSELEKLPEVNSPSVFPRVMARIDSHEQKRSFWLRALLEPLVPSFAGAAAAVMLLGFISGALLSSVYYPDSGQEQTNSGNSPYSELLSEAPAESFFDMFLQSAGQNGKENSL